MIPKPYKITPPSYELTINGASATTVLQTRLLSLSITDHAGYQSDSITISLDDRDGKLAIPDNGAEISAKMGYLAKLVNMGTFFVDRRSLSSPPEQFDIGGKSVDMQSALFTKKSKNWTKSKIIPTTLTQIVTEIAGDNDYIPKTSPTLSTLTFKNLQQVNQSDMDFLTELADDFYAVVKPINKFLIFSEKGQSAAVSGKSLFPVFIGPQDIISWKIELTERNNFGAVKVKWQNRCEKKPDTKEVEETSTTDAKSSKVFEVNRVYDSEDKAKLVAKAKLKELLQSRNTLTMTLIGEPSISAESKLIITGVREGINGSWVVKSSTHTINNSGYTTRVTAYQTEGTIL